MSTLIATWFCIGHLRPAPGTWGSLAALPFAWVLHEQFGPIGLTLAIALVFVLGLWATRRETEGTDNHDPSEIVVDEVVGQWIALLPVSYGAMASGSDVLALWPGIVVAFLGFRLFDIVKPGPVGWADRRNDAAGVMLDDVIAGLFAAFSVATLAALFHWVLM